MEERFSIGEFMLAGKKRRRTKPGAVLAYGAEFKLRAIFILAKCAKEQFSNTTWQLLTWTESSQDFGIPI